MIHPLPTVPRRTWYWLSSDWRLVAGSPAFHTSFADANEDSSTFGSYAYFCNGDRHIEKLRGSGKLFDPCGKVGWGWPTTLHGWQVPHLKTQG
jgi:hypothetical protein